MQLRLEIKKGAIVCLTQSWTILKACFSEIDYVEQDSMKAMLGHEFTVLHLALPSNLIPIIVLMSARGERSYFPVTAVAAVVREAPVPPPNHKPEQLFIIDKEHDYIEGATYELEVLPVHLVKRPLDEIIRYCARQCDEYDACGFFYQEEAAPPHYGGSGAVVGLFLAPTEMKGHRKRTSLRERGVVGIRMASTDDLATGQRVMVLGAWKGNQCFYDGIIAGTRYSHSTVQSIGPQFNIQYDTGSPEHNEAEGTLLPTLTESIEILGFSPPHAPHAGIRDQLTLLTDYSIGQRVLANWDQGASGAPWFVGEVRHANPPAPSYSVVYDNGQKEKAVFAKHMLALPLKPAPPNGYANGARVLANWGSAGIWYDGAVTVMDDGTLSVTYDDEQHSEEDDVSPADIILISNSYALGQEVKGLFRSSTGIDEWVVGSVVDVSFTQRLQEANNPALRPAAASCYSVQYEDGEVESNVLPECLRRPAEGVSSASYNVGDRVMAREHGGSKWIAGTVTAMHPPGDSSYSVAFDSIGLQAVIEPRSMRALGDSHFCLHMSA